MLIINLYIQFSPKKLKKNKIKNKQLISNLLDRGLNLLGSFLVNLENKALPMNF